MRIKFTLDFGHLHLYYDNDPIITEVEEEPTPTPDPMIFGMHANGAALEVPYGDLPSFGYTPYRQYEI